MTLRESSTPPPPLTARSLRKELRRPRTDEEFFAGTTPEIHARQTKKEASSDTLSGGSDEVDGDEEDRVVERSVQCARKKASRSSIRPIELRDDEMEDELQAHTGSKAKIPSRNKRPEKKKDKDPWPHFPPLPSSFEARRQDSETRKSQPHREENGRPDPSTDWYSRANALAREINEVSVPSRKDSALYPAAAGRIATIPLSLAGQQPDRRPVPSWLALSPAQKAHLLDTAAFTTEKLDKESEAHFLERVFVRLRLDDPAHRKDAVDTLLARQARAAKEREVMRRMNMSVMHKLLLPGKQGKIKQEEYHELFERHAACLIGRSHGNNHEADARAKKQGDTEPPHGTSFELSNVQECEEARAYWTVHCNFDPGWLTCVGGGWRYAMVNEARSVVSSGDEQ